MKRLLAILIFLPLMVNAQIKKPLTVDYLWAMKRIGSSEVSPNGKTIIFDVTTYNMTANKENTDIYLINSDGTGLHPVKNSDKNESDPKFTPNGKKITYLIDNQIHTGNLNWFNKYKK